MMKIGPQMLGRTVVCPRCEKKVEVPLESDPKAEELFRFIKEKRAREKQQGKHDAAETFEALTDEDKDLMLTPPPLLPGTTEKPIGEFNEGIFEHLESDEIDCWIKEFWNSNAERSGIIQKSTKDGEAGKSRPESLATGIEDADSALRNRGARTLVRLLLMIVFLLGGIVGFLLHALTDYLHRDSNTAVTTTLLLDSNTTLVRGLLTYRDDNGNTLPDADAVVVILPKDHVPAMPWTSGGLRPNDPNYDPMSENVQQIEELGGQFLRTGTDGYFVAEILLQGHYILLTISSHATRSEARKEIDPVILNDLKRFFRNPVDLVDNYCFQKDEFYFVPGVYFIRQTFVP